jgi:hypothetical protein
MSVPSNAYAWTVDVRANVYLSLTLCQSSKAYTSTVVVRANVYLSLTHGRLMPVPSSKHKKNRNKDEWTT